MALIKDKGLPFDEQLLEWQRVGRKVGKWEDQGLSFRRKYTDHVTFGRVLREMRTRRGWTGTEAAYRIGCYPVQLYKWEGDKGWPHAKYAMALLLVFPEFASIFKTLWPTVQDWEEHLEANPIQGK